MWELQLLNNFIKHESELNRNIFYWDAFKKSFIEYLNEYDIDSEDFFMKLIKNKLISDRMLESFDYSGKVVSQVGNVKYLEPKIVNCDDINELTLNDIEKKLEADEIWEIFSSHILLDNKIIELLVEEYDIEDIDDFIENFSENYIENMEDVY